MDALGGTGSARDVRIVHPHDPRRVLRARMTVPRTDGNAHPSPPAVLVIPGYLSGKDRLFHPVLESRLVAAGFAVCSADLSGSGYGDRGELTELELFAQNTYTWELEDAARLLEFLRSEPGVDPDRIGLMGHSRGAAIALVTAIEDRERSGSQLDSPRSVGALVLWAAPAHVGRYRPERLALWRKEGRLPVELPDGRTVYLERDLLDDFEPLPPRFHLLHRAPHCAVPTLLVRGSRDRAVGVEETADLAAALPDSTVLDVAGAGHNFGAREGENNPPDPRLEQALRGTLAWFERCLVP